MDFYLSKRTWVVGLWASKIIAESVPINALT